MCGRDLDPEVSIPSPDSLRPLCSILAMFSKPKKVHGALGELGTQGTGDQLCPRELGILIMNHIH